MLSGVIVGFIVVFDMCDMYLKDIILIGSIVWDEFVFLNFVGYIECGEIWLLLVKIFFFKDIV